MLCSVNNTSRKEKCKKVGTKFKFKLVKKKMTSKENTVRRNFREKEFEYLVSREVLQDFNFSLR
jgi:hypothetical protein